MVARAGRIPSLDGLRAISIGAVLLGHASTHFSIAPFQIPVIQHALSVLAYFGVTVFFVISGFLITSLLLSEQARTSRISVPAFYRRRAYRILPASLFYILVVLLVGHASVMQSVYAFTFTTTFFFNEAYKPLQHLWSLSVEEQFYLLWPLIFCTGIRNARTYCWSVMALSPVIRLAMLPKGEDVYSHFAPGLADSIAAGCLLAFYQEPIRKFVKKYFVSTLPFLGLSIVTVVVACGLYRYQWVLTWGLVASLIALVTCAAIERKDALLNSRPLVWMGVLSYSLYLWQQPFLVFDGPLNNLFFRLALTFACAYLSYRFVEQPMLMLRLNTEKPRKVPYSEHG